jgi:hypothetical protein
MFGMLTNVAKAAVSVVAAPIALAVDVVTLPASSMDPHCGAFDRTAELLDNVGDCITKAVKPDAQA